jgi:Domain of Unknown Function with PDB structure (DUF3857)
MRKTISAIISIFLAFSISHAQDYPDFGNPTKEEIELKECAFENEASAVVLIHEAFSYSEDNLQLITTHHFRIKILKQSGMDAANITIPFYRINHFERILNLEALTINISEDGKISKQNVTKKSFYTTKVNDIFGQINFTFPAIKPGSIIEYQYQSVMKNYWGLRDWYFQQEIPVIVSRYHLKTIYNKRFKYQVIKSTGLEVTVLPETDRIFFEMKNISGLSKGSEPYMDAKNDNIQRVNIWIGDYNSRWGSSQLGPSYSSWPLLNTLLLYEKGFGSQIVAHISGVDDLLAKAKAIPAEIEKMKLIYNFVRTNMTWNDIYSKFSRDGVNDAWQKHSGNSGDINFILINLLNKVQLKTYPLLVSQRFNGKVDTAYAYADQFNSVFACVEIKGQRYIMDATDKYTPVILFPESILNTTTFLIDRLSGELITVTSDELKYKLDINLDIQVTDNGLIKGGADIYSQGYAKIKKHSEYDRDTVKFQERYSKQKNIIVSTSKFEILNTKNDSLPLHENFEFSGTLNGTGDYKFIPVNLFTELDKNPFITDNRFSDINFGYGRDVNLNTVIKIPENYSVDGIPENLQVEFPEKDITFFRQINFNKSNNTITFILRIAFNKKLYKVAEYNLLKERYKKIFNLLEEQIVLKKK